MTYRQARRRSLSNGTIPHRGAVRLSVVLFVLFILAAPAHADTTDAAAASDTLTAPDTLHGPPTPELESAEDRARFDSLLAAIRSDTADSDAAEPVRIREFHAIETLFDSTRLVLRQIREPFVASLPQPADLATVDAAGWLVLQPTVDVNNASGPGTTRYSSRWGLVDRHQWWFDDEGESFDWQRLGYPQTARADLNVVPVFLYDSVTLRDQLYLHRDSDWPYHARSSYVLRQGFYGETYSQGRFRRLFAPGYGIDLGFGFYENNGTSFSQNHRNRHLRLRLVGPIGRNLFWNFRFNQFQDNSYHPPPSPYLSAIPRRDDLAHVIEGTVYRPTDSAGTQAPWIAGLTVQSGKHDIRDLSTGYRLETHTDRYDLWTRQLLRGWLVDARGILQTLRLGDDEPSRWGVRLSAARSVAIGASTDLSLDGTVSDWDNDPPAPEATIAIRFPAFIERMRPGINLSRMRATPTLFDRLGTRHTYPVSGGFTNNYAEIGDPALDAEWRNDLSLTVVRETDSLHSATFAVIAKAGYVEHYTTWEETFSSALDTTILTPVSRDVRHAGAAVSMSTTLPWKFETWLNYAFKYAEALDHEQLTDYYPHAATWVLSWIAPQLRYKIDVRLNSTLLWWVGDSRYDVTPYASSPHALRWDLSASARMQNFTFYYSLQNVTNFPYRTESGGDYAVQRMRFGIAWQFTN